MVFNFSLEKDVLWYTEEQWAKFELANHGN